MLFTILIGLFGRLYAAGAIAGHTDGTIRRAGFLTSLLRDSRGGSALLVAFGAPAIVGGLALSMDVGLWYLEKRRLQQITDTASLGAVQVLRSGGSVEDARKAALSDAIRNGYIADANSTLVINAPPAEGPYAGDPNAVEVIATRKVALLFSGFFLADAKTVQARAVAVHSSSASTTPRRNLEVVMMLDVSSSMAGPSEILGLTKLQAMQEAARKVVDVVVQPKQEPFSTRVAIVPYGSAVSVGDAHVKAVTGATSSARSSVIERTGASAFTDDAPGPGRYFPDYKPIADGLKGDKLTLEVLPQLREGPALTPLSGDKSALTAAINRFTAEGKTAGHIGLSWAWNVLSPKWTNIWSGANGPTDYDPEKTLKVAVLLSDFDMTVTYAKANGPASEQAMTLCTKMKQAGITIYTVGYRVPSGNATASRLWNGCASDSDKVYAASSAEELIASFASIAQSAVREVISVGPRLVE